MNVFVDLKKIFTSYREDVIIVTFFLILSFFYLGANLFSNEIVAPMDLLLHYPGWQNTGISPPVFNSLRSDILDALLPQWTFARNSILSGTLPLWEPYVAGGAPVLPLFTSSLLSPSFLVFFIFGGGIGFTLSLLVKLVIAGYGTYKLCRTEMTILPALFGGITFMMCGFNASWLMWTHVTTSMWIPWVLWGIIQLNKERTRIRYVLLSFFVALLIFGGFPFVAFGSLGIAFLLICWLIFIENKREGRSYGLKSGLLLMSSLVAGFGLAAVQILPFGEWLTLFDTTWRHGFSVLSTTDFDILWTPFKYTFTFGNNIVPQIERCGSVGIIAVIFSCIAIISLFRAKKNSFTPLSPLFWAILSVLIMIPVFAIEPVSSIVFKLPIFNSNASSRLLVLLGMTFSILGASGINEFLKITSEIEIKYKKIVKQCIIVIVITIIVIQTGDLAPIGKSQNAVVPGDSYYPDTATIEYVRNNLTPGQSVLTTSIYMVSGTITYYGISDWFAHNYHTESEKEVLGNIVSDAWNTPTASMFIFEQINQTSPLIDQLGIRYILASKNIQKKVDTEKWQIISVEKDIIILENRNNPQGAYIIENSDTTNPFISSDIRVLKYTPNDREYNVNSSQPGLFVTTTRSWPGWVAYVDDQPVPIKSHLGILQSVDIPEGSSVIRFSYVPVSFYLGLIISLIILTLLIFVPRKFFSF